MPQLARPALLEMLLKDEIRKERNHILQAVHFIVKNNFFDIKWRIWARTQKLIFFNFLDVAWEVVLDGDIPSGVRIFGCGRRRIDTWNRRSHRQLYLQGGWYVFTLVLTPFLRLLYKIWPLKFDPQNLTPKIWPPKFDPLNLTLKIWPQNLTL